MMQTSMDLLGERTACRSLWSPATKGSSDSTVINNREGRGMRWLDVVLDIILGFGMCVMYVECW